MNSTFRNSSLGFVLYIFIIAIMIVSTAFVVWFMFVGYRVGTYASGTRLGSVYIGGLAEEEVIPLMDERINYWYNDDTIVFQLTYQNYKYSFDRDLILFDLQLSTYEIKNGDYNTLVAYYQGQDIERIKEEILSLPFLQNVKDNLDLDGLIRKILEDASMMKSFSSQDVEDYLIDTESSVQIIFSAPFKVPEGVQIDDVISTLNARYPDGHIPIPAKEVFDIVDVLGNDLQDDELTMIASAMLETILYTNFIINEVNYNPVIDFTTYTVDNYPYYGRNVQINRVVGNSFDFYNPNHFTYYFVVNKVDEYNGTVRLYGLPFEYDIQVTVHKTQIPYVTQETTSIDLLQEGHNGVSVEVQREIRDLYNRVISDEIVIFEFYPPIVEIIFHP
jgi:hypothetical protein